MDNKVLRSHAAARIRIRFSNYSRLFSCNLTETDRSPRSGSETLVLMKSTICLGFIVLMVACARLQVSPRGLINEQPVKEPHFARCKKESEHLQCEYLDCSDNVNATQRMNHPTNHLDVSNPLPTEPWVLLDLIHDWKQTWEKLLILLWQHKGQPFQDWVLFRKVKWGEGHVFWAKSNEPNVFLTGCRKWTSSNTCASDERAKTTGPREQSWFTSLEHVFLTRRVFCPFSTSCQTWQRTNDGPNPNTSVRGRKQLLTATIHLVWKCEYVWLVAPFQQPCSPGD